MVVVPDKFVFLHWPRTGGMWLTGHLLACDGAFELESRHAPICDIPPEYQHLPTVSMVRDPVTWIESHYNHREYSAGWQPKSTTIDRYRHDTVDNYVTDLMANHPALLTQYVDSYATGVTHILATERLEPDARHLFERYGLQWVRRSVDDNHSAAVQRLSPDVADAWRCSNATYCEQFGYPLPSGQIYALQPWVGHWERTARHILAPLFRGRAIDLVEIGVCEGRSAVESFATLLQHPDSTYTGVDIWLMNPRHRAERNIAAVSGGRHQLIDGDALDSAKGAFDVVYIDGNHSHNGCLLDLNRWQTTVRADGVIVVDDYGTAELPGDNPGVKTATDQWLSTLGPEWAVIHRGYQIAIQRKGDRWQHRSRPQP
jgi:hypothetical protein